MTVGMGSVSAFGTGNMKPSGAGNITIASGLATFSVSIADIEAGAGVAIDYNSLTSYLTPQRIAFTSGDLEILPDDVLEGNTSGALGGVRAVEVLSGSWAGNDAAGWIYFFAITGTWNSSEQINRPNTSETNLADTNGSVEGNGTTIWPIKQGDGSAAANQTSTAVTSIHHVWASSQAAESAYLTGNFVNNSSLIAATTNFYFACYKDHDDQTADSTFLTVNGATTDADYYLQCFTPVGGAESINNQRPLGALDTNKYYNSAGFSNQDRFTRFQGFQLSTSNSSNAGFTIGAETVLDSNVFAFDAAASFYHVIQETGNTGISILKNNVFYQLGITSRGNVIRSEFATPNNTELKLYYNTIYGGVTGVSISASVTDSTVVDNISVGNTTTDYNGGYDTFTNNGDEDGTGQLTLGTLTDEFEDVANYDFRPKSAASFIAQGIPVTGIYYDIVNAERDGTNTDMGAHKFVSAGGDTLTASDNLELTDSVGMTAAASMSMTDTLEIIDTASLTAASDMNMNENIEISDNLSGIVAALMGLADTVEFSDTASAVASVLMSLSDTAVFSEQVSLITGNIMNLSDTAELSDTFSADSGVVSMTMADNVTFVEAFNAISAAVLSLEDGVVLTELVSLSTGELVEGPVKISVQVKQVKFDIVVKKPGFDVDVKKPKFDIEIN